MKLSLLVCVVLALACRPAAAQLGFGLGRQGGNSCPATQAQIRVLNFRAVAEACK